MSPSGTFWSILSNGYHGNNDHYKKIDFRFRFVLKSSMIVQCFIAIKWQEAKL